MAVTAEEIEKKQQQALVLSRARQRQAEVEREDGFTEQLSRFGQGVNVGLTDLVGGLGRKQLADLGMAPPPGEEPEGVAGASGRVVGMTPAALPFVGVGARLANLPSAALRTGEAILGNIGRTAVTAPGRTLAGEVTAASLAGAGGFIAAERFPETPGAQAMGEIVGGMTPAALPLAARASLVNMVGRGVRDAAETMSATGATRRAKERFQRAMPEGASQTDVIEGIPFTPAQRTGEPGMLSLERSVMDATEELSAQRARQFADVNEALRAEIGQFETDANPEQIRTYLRTLLDTRLQQAAARMDERLSEMGTRANREDVNRLAFQEIDDALKAARAQERQLYGAIPQEAMVPTEATTSRFLRLRDELGQAQQRDIPVVAQRLLDPESKKHLGESTTVLEMRSLQSRLREEARISRAAGKRNRARIADDLANAITDDIAQVSGTEDVVKAVRTATSYSKDLNDRFTRGTVGRLLGHAKEGGSALPLGLTLETTVGQSGARAREATDALLEAVRRTGDEPAMRGHIQDFLTDSFRRAAVKDGEIDPKAADRFMSKNEDVLNRFPELRRQMEQAKTSGEELTALKQQTDPRVARAAVYIQAPPGKEIDRILAQSEPRESMMDLMHMARTDPSGQAEKGLKQAFMDRLLDRSQVQAVDVTDQPFVSGQRLSRELDNPSVQQASEALFTDAERARVEAIKRSALLFDQVRAAPRAAEGVIGDAPGMVTSVLGRILGAQIGREIAGRTTGGTVQTPGILANSFQRLMFAGINDPARRLINDAIQDEELFRAIMARMDVPEQERFVRQRINAWMLSVLGEQNDE